MHRSCNWDRNHFNQIRVSGEIAPHFDSSTYIDSKSLMVLSSPHFRYNDIHCRFKHFNEPQAHFHCPIDRIVCQRIITCYENTRNRKIEIVIFSHLGRGSLERISILLFYYVSKFFTMYVWLKQRLANTSDSGNLMLK